MILVEADLVDVDGKSFLESFERFEDGIDDLWFQDSLPVLDCDLNVVVTLGDRVVPTPDIFGNIDHGAIVSVCCRCWH